MELKHLRNLSLRNNVLGSEGAKQLSSSKWPQLTQLNLYGNMIKDEGVQHLLRADWKRLQQILLDDNHVSIEGLKSVIAKSIWENLIYLGFKFNLIEREEVTYSFMLTRWRNIKAGKTKRFL